MNLCTVTYAHFLWFCLDSGELFQSEIFFFYRTNSLIFIVYGIAFIYFAIFFWNCGFICFRSLGWVLHHSLGFSLFFFVYVFLSWFFKSDIWFATSYNLFFMAPKAFWILLVTSFRSQILLLFQLSKFLLKFIQKIHQKLLSENFSCLLGENFAQKYFPWTLKMVAFLYCCSPLPHYVWWFSPIFCKAKVTTVFVISSLLEQCSLWLRFPPTSVSFLEKFSIHFLSVLLLCLHLLAQCYFSMTLKH